MNILNILQRFCDFLIGTTNNAYTYLTAISGIIAAILPFTTIIFTQFYSNSAERTNEMLWNLQNKLKQEKVQKEEVYLEIKKMIYAGGNSRIYSSTLTIFKLISYVLLILWFLVCMGYMKNDGQNRNSPTDFVIIFVSTGLLFIILLAFPRIFTNIKKRVPLEIKNNGCSIKSIEENFVKNRGNKDAGCEFYLNYQKPRINFLLKEDRLFINFSQNIPIVDFVILWILKTSTNKRLYIKLDIDNINNHNGDITFEITETQKKNLSFFIKEKYKTKTTNIPHSLPLLFEKIEKSSSKVFIVDKDKRNILSGEIGTYKNEDGIIKYYIKKSYTMSIQADLKRILNQKGSIIEYYSSETELKKAIKEV